jgi:penicillin-insensitive murein endopeptidase
MVFFQFQGALHERTDSMRIRMTRPALGLLVATLTVATVAAAQDKGTLEPHVLPPLEHPDNSSTPARQLFGRIAAPTNGSARVEGFYSNGCLAGAVALPVTGPEWQVMRLSRNRNWGHPGLVRFLEDLAAGVHGAGGWNGLLVGDMSQPRGGPMMTGHASHQVGLDADIWLTPMPDHELPRQEREEMSATMMVAEDRKDIDPEVWTSGHAAVIKAAARDPRVERIFVNAAIKKALCRDADPDREWLTKVRPYWGHDYHFHVRLYCPPDSPDCRPQPPPPPGEGCGKDLDWWFTDEVLHPKPKPEKPRPPLTMANLPPACRGVLSAPATVAVTPAAAPEAK